MRERYGLELKTSVEAGLSSGQHGKPYLRDYPGIHFNISHCEGLVACAFSDTETGVDVERIREVKEKVIPKVFDRAEQELLFSYKAEKEKYEEKEKMVSDIIICTYRSDARRLLSTGSKF